MDNVTHSLIGLMTGDAFARATPGSDSGLPVARRRTLIVALAIVANNLPDLDLLYSSSGRLHYLLEHRGYTHTIIGCAVLALLLYAGIAAWLARRKVQLTRTDHVTFGGIVFAGVALHLAMDALNSYGVHPFWPLDNRWRYGDSVFIVEPLYWAAAAPLIFGLRTWTARIVLGLLLLAAVAASVLSGLVAEPVPILFAVLVLTLLAVARRIGPRAASFLSINLFVVVTLVFIAAGRIAAARVEALLHVDFPADRLLDHVLTPMPVNPLCWDVLVLELHDDAYIARHTTLALAPRLVSTAACGRGFLDRPTFVSLTHLPVSSPSGIEWREVSMPGSLLAKLAADHCDAAAFLQFARAPFALDASAGWTLGDLRFNDSRSAARFNIDIEHAAATGPCPWTPPWVPPREDLLTPPSATFSPHAAEGNKVAPSGR